MRIFLIPVAALTLYAAAHNFAYNVSPAEALRQREIAYSAEEYAKRAGMGEKDVIRLFLESGMNVDSRDKNGATALIRAAENGHIEVIKLLLSRNADKNASDNNGYTALMAATEGSHPVAVSALVSAGANLDARTPKWGISALMMACSKGDMSSVDALLKGGADVNGTDKNGYTALMLVAEKGDMAAVKKLVEHGADIKARNTIWGVNASHIAANTGHRDIARFLSQVKTRTEKSRVKVAGTASPAVAVAASTSTEARPAAPDNAKPKSITTPRWDSNPQTRYEVRPESDAGG